MARFKQTRSGCRGARTGRRLLRERGRVRLDAGQRRGDVDQSVPLVRLAAEMDVRSLALESDVRRRTTGAAFPHEEILAAVPDSLPGLGHPLDRLRRRFAEADVA